MMKINLRKILQEKGISISNLQSLTGISRSTLTPLSKNDKLPSKTRFETLEKICSKLEIFEDDLLSFDPWEITTEDLVEIKKNLTDHFYLTTFGAHNREANKKFTLATTVRSAFPFEYDAEDFEFKIRYDPTYKKRINIIRANGIWEEDKSEKISEKEIAEYRKLYETFKKKLDEKYRSQIKVISVHFSSITPFDINVLRTNAPSLIENVQNIDLDLVRLFDAENMNQIITSFMEQSNLNNLEFGLTSVDTKELLDTDSIPISLKLKRDEMTVYKTVTYNKSNNEILPEIWNGYSHNAITDAFNIPDPDDSY